MSALATHEAAMRASAAGLLQQAEKAADVAPLLTAMANAHLAAADILRAQIMAGVQDSPDDRQ